MTRVIMYGCNGKMGQTITRLIEEENDVEIVAGIDVCDTVKNSYPVFQNIADCDVEADVVIDFSSPVCTDALLDNRTFRGTACQDQGDIRKGSSPEIR